MKEGRAGIWERGNAKGRYKGRQGRGECGLGNGNECKE